MTEQERAAAHEADPQRGQRSFGPLEGNGVEAFEDETRAAPVGPTRGADIRDLSGTPNEGLSADEDPKTPPND